MNTMLNIRWLCIPFLFVLFINNANIYCQGSMDLIFSPTSATSGGCISNSNCSSNTLCYLLEYTPAYTGVVTSYTTGFFASCISGNNPYLSSVSCTMTNNSGVTNGCSSINAVLMNLSGNSGGLNVTVGVPVYLHQICFNIAPGMQTVITKDDITDLTVSVDLSGAGGPIDDVASFVPKVLAHNTECNLLPIELISFDVKKIDRTVQLSWITLTEINNDYFDIEWSTDGMVFLKIGSVNGSGSSYEKLFYNFIHTSAATGNNYYRLKQVDINGKVSYSEIKYINFDGNENNFEFKIFPNPTYGDYVTIELLNESLSGEVCYKILDLSGKEIISDKWEIKSNIRQIDVSQIISGTYILNFVTTSGSYNHKLFKF